MDSIDAGVEALLGKVVGSLDSYGEKSISGWARYNHRVDKRVHLGVYIDDKRIGDALADHFRDDLLKAGVGDGHHAFEFTLPERAFRPPLQLELRAGGQILKHITIDRRKTLQPVKAARIERCEP